MISDFDRAGTIIHGAENALGYELTAGECRDLLRDNTEFEGPHCDELVAQFFAKFGRDPNRKAWPDYDDSYPPPCSNPEGHSWVVCDDNEEISYCEWCGADGNA